MNKKTTVIFIVIVLAVAGFLVYKNGKKKDNNVSQNNKPDTEEIVNSSELLTYTNNEYGISFQYPKNWRIVDGEDQVSETYIALVLKGDTTPRSRMLVAIGTQNRIKTQEELYKSNEVDNNDKTTNLNINGNSATLVKVVSFDGSEITYMKTFIFSDQNTYTMTLQHQARNYEDFKEVFRIIYSSFKTF